MTMDLSGEQYVISHGNQQAVITQQGATLRSYTVDGRDIVSTFADGELPAGSQGQQLLPWPNRIRDGRYDFDGTTHQLPLNEPARGNAIHGLARWMPFRLVRHSDHEVALKVLVLPQPGWPGVCECTITHVLDDDGLRVEVEATNLGDKTFPFGYAAHPYLVMEGAALEQWRIHVPFDTCLKVDERLLPIELAPVEADTDMLSPTDFGARMLDTAFTNPSLDDGRWFVVVAAGGHRTVVWGDDSLGWLQLYTPEGRTELAVEPMSVGPDAFNPGPTHEDLTLLAPGQSVRHVWGISPAS